MRFRGMTGVPKQYLDGLFLSPALGWPVRCLRAEPLVLCFHSAYARFLVFSARPGRIGNGSKGSKPEFQTKSQPFTNSAPCARCRTRRGGPSSVELFSGRRQSWSRKLCRSQLESFRTAFYGECEPRMINLITHRLVPITLFVGSSLFRMGSDGAAIVRKQGRKAAAPAASSILTGRRLALTERAQVARIPTQIANSLLALRHRADARRTSAKFAVRLIVAQLHGPTVSVLPTPNSEEPFCLRRSSRIR